MQIGILGGGNVGSALARLALAAGHDVRIGQRDPRRDDGLPVTDPAAACAHGDVVILAIPFVACGGALGSLALALAGKIVVDATNPLREDWSPLPLTDADSAAHHIAALLPGARMVKAFNTVFADVMTADGLQRRGGQRLTAFIASDDSEAAATVAALATSLGFAPLPVGGLAQARHLEAMAHLNIAIAVGCGLGTNAGFVYDRAD